MGKLTLIKTNLVAVCTTLACLNLYMYYKCHEYHENKMRFLFGEYKKDYFRVRESVDNDSSDRDYFL